MAQVKKPDDILVKLASLHAQATEERSHYYVGACVREAIAEIVWLRSEILKSRAAIRKE